MSDTETKRRPMLHWLALLGGVLAAVGGVGLILLAVTLGHCSAFGGRCPSQPPPLLDDDATGMAAMGGFLAIGGPLFGMRPSWMRLVRSTGAGLLSAAIVGFLVRSSIHV